ncbi:MAG: diaminopimelate epimerase [Candidatus Azotimanducaceae bacterium]|jgi:diaminopimelate epimerase|tara:strand:+ start:1036 stop:1884 length:849 start_codon:yes stop_codon:yes gene_type:complete
MIVNFSKMHGVGNDFAVIDLVTQAGALSPSGVKGLAHRHTGVGFDQLLTIEPPTTRTADFFYRIYNADGSESGQCGNGARCVAKFIYDKQLSPKSELVLQTSTGQLTTQRVSSQYFRVNMGPPELDPAAIPFQPGPGEQAPFSAAFQDGSQYPFGIANLGNPHAVLVVNRVDDLDVAGLAAEFRTQKHFEAGVNVGFMALTSDAVITLRVSERGAGETLACGSGACAAVAVGRVMNLLADTVSVEMPGGAVKVTWPGPGQDLWLAGPAIRVFDGKLKINDRS